MAQNLTNFDAVLKDFYLGPIRRQLNDRVIFLRRMERRTDVFSGRQIVTPLSFSRNAGVGSRSDGGTLPTPGNQQYRDLILKPKYIYGSIKITGPTIAASRNNAGAFVRAVRAEMDGMMRDLRRDVNRQFYNDSFGTIAGCASNTSTTTLQLDADANMNLFYEGMKIDIKNSSGADITGGGDRTVVSIDRANKTITIDSAGGAVTTADTDAIFLSDSRGLEIEGLEAWVGSETNTVGGIDRSDAANGWFRPNVLDNGGTLRSLSLDLLQQANDEAEARAGGRISIGITSHGVRRKYVALVRADRRHVNTMELDGGFTGVEFNGYPLIVDSQAPLNTVWLLDESTFFIAQMADFDWLDEDGQILHRIVGSNASEDAYEATLAFYGNLVNTVPAANAALKDITE
ncbi:MAG TPA: phage major capsid protein [Hyphomicrobiaceae bacterium]